MTNYDSDLVLHKAILLSADPEARMAAPIYGSDNTLTVSWSTREASTIQPVVAESIRIRVLHSRQFELNPSIFYHPGQEFFMADDTSCLFYISDTSPLVYISAAYPQLYSS